MATSLLHVNAFVPDAAPSEKPAGGTGSASVAASASSERLRGLVAEHYRFVWRTLRRFGVPEGDVEDAAQKVLLVLSDRLAMVAVGAEKSFLFQTAWRTASDVRKARSRRVPAGMEPLAEVPCDRPSIEDALDRKRARALLDVVLDEMPMELRAVFVLVDLEETTMAEAAVILDLPPGTVASRLRRARERFAGAAEAVRRRLAQEGMP